MNIIYHKPVRHSDRVYKIGYSKLRGEKCGMYIFFMGTEKEAQAKIDSYDCKKYKAGIKIK